ncbi:cyclophilin type peptidyl-prolyl cis-trans isomerase/CLD domain-containing protein [Ditylenchus destructor]|nr:cyclophilin type peptidyl-prolyl cis-trans isomerase/CLD domain-containing protein [Ditylenchus destructor]
MSEPILSEASVSISQVTTTVIEEQVVTSKRDRVREPIAETNDEESVAKKPKKILKYEETYLRSIPRASQYEKSFMHRDVITHVFATETDFVITASQDGHLKFWKKKHNQGIEFVKHFRCHLKEFSDIAVNYNGVLMATCCKQDKSVKVFDVPNFDMINMFKLDFHPRALCWVHKGTDLYSALAVSDSESGRIEILDGKGTTVPLHVIENLHSKPVILMDYSHAMDLIISIDEMGMIEYSSGSRNSYGFPNNCKWEYKTDTDLFELLKLKQFATSLKISPNGSTFSIVTSDRTILIFDLKTAMILTRLNETLQRYVERGKETKGFGMQNMEWNRRIALEKELNKDPASFRYLRIAYDESSNFLIYPTPLGISVYNIITGEVIREIGKGENIRFLGVALCKAVPNASEKLQGAATSFDVEAAENPNLKAGEPDPMIIACGCKRNRFYIFTNVEPYSTEDEGDGASRDIFNEKPTKEDIITSVADDAPQTKLCDKATIHTTYGDIYVELYPDKCPKTVENFCTHARRGYYNGHTFHRVIKSFMIQLCLRNGWTARIPYLARLPKDSTSFKKSIKHQRSRKADDRGQRSPLFQSL